MAPFAVLLAGCAASGHSSTSAPDAAGTSDDAAVDTPPPTPQDRDADGLDDAYEQQLAADYLPYLSLDSSDGCPLDGIVARVRKHPADPTKVLIVYTHLFQRDCGLAGHVGDDEAFGVAIDPNVPAPAGILAIKTASHQGTPCERDSECATCAGDSRPRCDTANDAGKAWPVLFASKDKHGQYATKSSCSAFGTCFDQCSLNSQRARPPIIDVGEPAYPFTHNLTADAFITPANGWTEPALMNFDPWTTAHDFGGAGNIASDLQDAAFEPAPCH